jgi:hypothetical protein
MILKSQAIPTELFGWFFFTGRKRSEKNFSWTADVHVALREWQNES